MEVLNLPCTDLSLSLRKKLKEKDGSFTSYVALEMNNDKLKVAIENKLSDKAKIAVD